MKNSLITRLPSSLDKEDAPFLGELRIELKGVGSKEISINDVDSFIGTNNEPWFATLSNTDAVFSNNTKKAEFSSYKNPIEKIKLKSGTDKFTFGFNKYSLGYLILNDRILDSIFNIEDLKYSKSLNYIQLNGEKIIGDIKVFKNHSFTNFNLQGSPNIYGNLADIPSAVFKNESGGIINGSGISGDLSILPKNVAYINLGIYNTDGRGLYTWTKGNRTGEDTSIICGFNKGKFASAIDVDNMLIDAAGSTLNPVTDSHDGYNKIINCYVIGDYTPSSDAQSAIRTLYDKGLSRIIVNDIELNR